MWTSENCPTVPDRRLERSLAKQEGASSLVRLRAEDGDHDYRSLKVRQGGRSRARNQMSEDATRTPVHKTLECRGSTPLC